MFKTPKEFINNWMEKINSHKIDELLQLYNPEAVLIPTFSNKILSTPEKIKDYFYKISSHDEIHISLHEKTLLVHKIEESKFALYGIYCWNLSVDGELLSFEARFSYLIDISLKNPILHHHSSQIPRML